MHKSRSGIPASHTLELAALIEERVWGVVEGNYSEREALDSNELEAISTTQILAEAAILLTGVRDPSGALSNLFENQDLQARLLQDMSQLSKFHGSHSRAEILQREAKNGSLPLEAINLGEDLTLLFIQSKKRAQPTRLTIRRTSDFDDDKSVIIVKTEGAKIWHGPFDTIDPGMTIQLGYSADNEHLLPEIRQYTHPSWTYDHNPYSLATATSFQLYQAYYGTDETYPLFE